MVKCKKCGFMSKQQTITKLINSGWEFGKNGPLCYVCNNSKGFSLMKFFIGGNKKGNSGEADGNDLS